MSGRVVSLQYSTPVFIMTIITVTYEPCYYINTRVVPATSHIVFRVDTKHWRTLKWTIDDVIRYNIGCFQLFRLNFMNELVSELRSACTVSEIENQLFYVPIR